MRIALAQMNSLLGDFSTNSKKILEFCNEAIAKHCELIVFPELNVFGYHPCDLLERPAVVESQNQAISELVPQLPKELHCLIGAVTFNPAKGKPYSNSALLVSGGKIQKVFSKELLPVYDVFDDSRHFAPGQIANNYFDLNGKRVQVLICEDMWGWDSLHADNPITDLDASNIDLVVNLSASPFTPNKRRQRLDFITKTSDCLKAPLVYVNMVGGQDELIYDGGSLAMSANQEVIAQSAYFAEDLNVVDLSTNEGGIRTSSSQDIEHIHQALVLGIRDFMGKIGLKHAHLGLSGGIDSALVACLVADAIGPQNLTCIALPSQFNSQLSHDLAEQLCKNIGTELKVLPIQDTFETAMSSFQNCFGKKEFSLVNENMQARLRGLFLMAFSNDRNSLLVTTGNKSEYATGYSTLYGDMCGGLAPIADLLKEQVYQLSRFYNREHEVIPEEIITRPPTAELRENQKDSDSLPAYDELDRSVESLVGQRSSVQGEVDSWVLKRLYQSEFKRWQAPPILKVSDHAFGRGRRMPIAHRAST